MDSVERVPEKNYDDTSEPVDTLASPPTPTLSLDQKLRDAKTIKIKDACKWKDIDALRELALTGKGLVSDEARRQAWPLLLGCDHQANVKTEAIGSWQDLPRHSDEEQVQLDVNRSFIYYPKDQSPKEIETRKQELSDLIVEVLRRQPYLHYFQGYHDICQVFLLVLRPRDRATAVGRLSALRIRDYMLSTLSPSLAHLRLIPEIIYTSNPKLYSHLPPVEPFFAIQGIITMYAHDVQTYGDIARIFDALLAREAVFSVYMFAQIILQRAEELYDIPSDDPDMFHFVLSKLPKNLNLEGLISDTEKLIKQHPPENLKAWRVISPSSVLKTARWPSQVCGQSLTDGQMYYTKQEQELKTAEQRAKLWKLMYSYRRPARAVGLAVLVGVFAFSMRNSSGLKGASVAFWRYWSGRQT